VRIAFILQDLQLSGGVGVVVEHASQLNRRHGFECSLVVTGRPTDAPWPYRGLADVRVLGLEEARDERFDVAVASWWETTLDLFTLEADRHAYFIQLLEDSTYPIGWPERAAAAMTMALPVRFITEARWIADTVELMQPGNRVLYVRNGIPKDVFAGPERVEPALDGPLRIVVEGSRALAHKGVDDALHAAALMREEHETTLVTGNVGTGPPPVADRVLTGISHAQMAELLREQHVMLKLTRAEGMYGPPLEGFHMGATVATTPVTGFDEYIRHQHNGLVVGWDDPHGTARALDLLARDRSLLHCLRTNAFATAAGWPSWEQSSQFMALALRAVHRDPPPLPQPAGVRLASELATDIAEQQRLRNQVLAKDAHLEAVFDQRAWQLAIHARRQYHRVRQAGGRAKRFLAARR
jgi:glycosyltransferase involved in cell wall biosynthesis